MLARDWELQPVEHWQSRRSRWGLGGWEQQPSGIESLWEACSWEPQVLVPSVSCS